MRLQRRSAAVIVAALFLAGCGGGGGSTPATQHVASPAGTATTAPSGAPLAIGKLTIKYPASLHHAGLPKSWPAAKQARLAAANASKAPSKSTATATKRQPAYVNSTPGYYLDIFVDGVPVVNPSATEDGGNVLTSSDGTQTFSIPLLSTQSHQIVAVETDKGLNYVGEGPSGLLAIGEYDMPTGSFNPGDAPVIGLTMLMNVVGIGITSDPVNGTDAEAACTAQYDSECDFINFEPSLPAICSAGNSYPPLYVFTADWDGSWVSGAGAGVTIPTLSNWASSPLSAGNTLTASSGLGGGYTITYPSNITSAVVLNLAAANPAVAVYNDYYEEYNYGDYGDLLYPGIDALVNSGTIPSNIFGTITVNNGAVYNNDVLNASIQVNAACD